MVINEIFSKLDDRHMDYAVKVGRRGTAFVAEIRVPGYPIMSAMAESSGEALTAAADALNIRVGKAMQDAGFAYEAEFDRAVGDIEEAPPQACACYCGGGCEYDDDDDEDEYDEYDDEF